MRRPLALLAAVIAISAAPAGAREPLDLDLTLLGAPDPEIWKLYPPDAGPLTDPEAAALAADAKVRFARLATDLTLAFTSALLQPATTSGHSGFAVDLEAAYSQVGSGVIGTTAYTPAGATAPAYPRDYWPSRDETPSELLLTSVHVRKALPFSLELGGRFTYLARSSYFAAQVEGKWAIVEGYQLWPDVALRLAYNRLFGPRDLELRSSELDLMASKRFGLNAVTSITPYLALRLTTMNARTKTMNFSPDYPSPAGPLQTPAEVEASSAAFPAVRALLYRTTVGVRLGFSAVSLAAEATYFDGGTQGKRDPDFDDYPEYWTPASLSAALKFGFEF